MIRSSHAYAPAGVVVALALVTGACAPTLRVLKPGRTHPQPSAPVAVDVRYLGEKTYQASGSFRVAVPRERAWAVLTDYDNADQFVPSIRESHVMKRTPEGLFIFQKAEWKWAFLKWLLDTTFRVEEVEDRRLSFQNVAGDFLKYEGFWRLTSQGERETRVEYYALLKPDITAPPFALLRAQRTALLLTLTGFQGEMERSA